MDSQFKAELLNFQARKKFQNEQALKWYENQMLEKKQAKNNQDAADRLYDLKQRELDERACDLQKAEEDCRKAINMATSNYNNALVRFFWFYFNFLNICLN